MARMEILVMLYRGIEGSLKKYLFLPHQSLLFPMKSQEEVSALNYLCAFFCVIIMHRVFHLFLEAAINFTCGSETIFDD